MTAFERAALDRAIGWVGIIAGALCIDVNYGTAAGLGAASIAAGIIGVLGSFRAKEF